ncbi:MAG TPA: 6-phosphogluconate dehydrogenase, partial [Candidatus Latescibacteria bacterium]|nr:6-phosphogluconate dehydrogenase [Candidatus Latescibacterota bacterium]
EAEIRDIPEMDDLVREVDLILAILVPDQTIPLARQVAASIKRTGTQPAYADCNAIAPNT